MEIFIPYLVLAIIALVCVPFIIYGVFAMKSAAPFVPAMKKNVKKMIKEANIQSDETVMDLGSGDGRIVRMAAPYAKESIGIEINPVLYYLSRFLHLFNRKKNITYLRKNLWKVSLAEVDVLFLFFISTKMPKLKEKIMKEMKPGSRVVSHTFSFPDWKPEKKHGIVSVYRVE